MTDDTISRPSRTTAAAVSSQDVSMPSTNMSRYSNLRRSSVTNRLALNSVFDPTYRLFRATCSYDDVRRSASPDNYPADPACVSSLLCTAGQRKQCPNPCSPTYAQNRRPPRDKSQTAPPEPGTTARSIQSTDNSSSNDPQTSPAAPHATTPRFQPHPFQRINPETAHPQFAAR